MCRNRDEVVPSKAFEPTTTLKTSDGETFASNTTCHLSFRTTGGVCAHDDDHIPQHERRRTIV
jgi:hypothetical protein